MDTLDYSGTGLNQGSKVIIAAAGKAIRNLSRSVPGSLDLPAGFTAPALAMPGVFVIEAPSYANEEKGAADAERLSSCLAAQDLGGFPLVVLTEDSGFASRNISNFLWVTFTRSNPSHDIYGVGAFIRHKHWGCTGPLIIDARLKPHHAPPLIEDPTVTRRVDELALKGRSLHGIL